MTIDEKISAMSVGIAPDVADNEVLKSELMTAEDMILNKMFPFGYPDGTAIPARYERLQVKLAIELYTQRGAEGQSSHSENGISRSFSQTSKILSEILPHIGSVTNDA